MYMAPEVFARSYTELCDVWSSALVIFELVCGKPYFGHLPEAQLEQAPQPRCFSMGEPWGDFLKRHGFRTIVGWVGIMVKQKNTGCF